MLASYSLAVLNPSGAEASTVEYLRPSHGMDKESIVMLRMKAGIAQLGSMIYGCSRS